MGEELGIWNLLGGDNSDQLWLDTINVPYTVAADPMSLIGKYRNEVGGAVIYGPTFLDSINVATSIAGVLRGVAATADLANQYQLPILQ